MSDVKDPRKGPGTWPFRTETALRVWLIASDLIQKNPDIEDRIVIQRSIDEAEIDTLDLTAEDWRLLEMAIEWKRSANKNLDSVYSDKILGMFMGIRGT